MNSREHGKTMVSVVMTVAFTAGLALVTLEDVSSAQSREDSVTGAELLKETAHAYGTVAEYRDRGYVMTRVLSEREGRRRQHFSTVFVRPGRLEFEFLSRTRVAGPANQNLWTVDPTGAWVTTFNNVRKADEEQLVIFVAGAGRIGGERLAHLIPKLLMPDRFRGWGVGELGAPRIVADDESVHDFATFTVEATVPDGGKLTLWIDKHEFLIRKARLRWNFAPTGTVESVYNYEVDVSSTRPSQR